VGGDMGTMKKIDAITTFLGHDAIIDGTIEFKGVIRVDGEITGKVQSDDGTIIVGEKAVINGDITVGNALVTGEVNGNIDAKSRVEIYSPDPGSFFNGKCMMTSRMASQKKSDFLQDKSIAVNGPEGKEKKSKKL
jgi:cytoskeletal protein CcmA (bactofilin family)